jgi:hypothetical protein
LNVRAVLSIAALGVGAPAVRSGDTGQALLTVPDTAGAERAEVPHAFVASMV